MPGPRSRSSLAALLADQLYRAVVVAVIAVRVVEVTLNEVIRVVTVRHGVVAAAGSVLVARVVFRLVVGGVRVGIGVAHR